MDLSWDGQKIYRFLRAMNYGTPDFFMYMRVYWEGKAYRFFNYRKMEVPTNAPGVSFDEMSRKMIIRKDGLQIELYALEQLVESSGL